MQLEANSAVKIGCPGERFAELVAKKLKDAKSPYFLKAVDGVVTVVAATPASTHQGGPWRIRADPVHLCCLRCEARPRRACPQRPRP